MNKGPGNFGPDIFFRKLRTGIRYFFICIWTSAFLALASAISYLYLVLPSGSFSRFLQYIPQLIRWELKGDPKSREIVLGTRRFFKNSYPDLWSSLDIAVWSFIAFLVINILIFWYIGRKAQADKHLRGSQLISSKKLQKELIKNSRSGPLNFYTFGKHAVTLGEEYHWLGMAILGRPGTGKSNLIRTMLEQDLMRESKCFIIDINGDYWKKFGRPGKDKVLSLRYKESEFWDPKAEDVPPSLLASYLVPQSKAGPDFFPKAARGVLEAIIRNSIDLDDFKEKISMSVGEILDFLESRDENVSKVIGKDGTSQAIGVIGNTVLDLGFLQDLGVWPRQKGKKEPFSIVNWASSKDDTSWVYVVINDNEIDAIRPLMACWFNLAVNGCFRRDEEECRKGKYPPIRFFLDEMKTLGRLEELEKAGERLRKHQATLVLGYQNNAQLNEIFGKNGADNLKDVLQVKFIHSIGEQSAQDELSRLLGERDVEETNASLSYGRKDDSYSQSHRVTVGKRVVLPSEIGKLRSGECYLKIANFDPAKVKIPLKKFENINSPLVWEIPSKGNLQKDQSTELPVESDLVEASQDDKKQLPGEEEKTKPADEKDTVLTEDNEAPQKDSKKPVRITGAVSAESAKDRPPEAEKSKQETANTRRTSERSLNKDLLKKADREWDF